MNDTLIRTLDRGRLQILLLVADLPDADLARQPAPGMNHPAWILGHLAILDVITSDALQDHPAPLPPHTPDTSSPNPPPPPPPTPPNPPAPTPPPLPPAAATSPNRN